MSNIWVTSDHHFGHENIIKYCNRPFSSVEEMDEVMIERWNSVVKPKDHIYYLGDFTLDRDEEEVYERVIRKLNGGTFTWIAGNHDLWLKTKRNAHLITTGAHVIYKNFTILNNKVHVVMGHFPFASWNRSAHGSIHLHGHCHNTMEKIPNRLDVGVDTNNFYPYSLEEAYKKATAI